MDRKSMGVASVEPRSIDATPSAKPSVEVAEGGVSIGSVFGFAVASFAGVVWKVG